MEITFEYARKFKTQLQQGLNGVYFEDYFSEEDEFHMIGGAVIAMEMYEDVCMSVVIAKFITPINLIEVLGFIRNRCSKASIQFVNKRLGDIVIKRYRGVCVGDNTYEFIK